MVHLALAVLCSLLLLPAPARAWDAETHYAWTYYVALHAGYTERQAHQIASAAQAVADDPETAVQPADWRDPGGALGEKARKVAHDFHCFAEPPNLQPRNALEALGWVPVLDVPPGGEAHLWKLAVETGNPGPLVHFVQDCVVHRGFSATYAHAAAGHFPDWIATDIEKSREMTFHTARVLVKFQQEVLGVTPPPVDRDRLFAVLDQIAEENHVDLSGIIGEEGPADPVDFLAASLAKVPPAESIARRKALEPTLAEKFDTGRPSVDAAIRILAAAIREDKVLGRLPGFEEEGWEPPPLSWLPYDLDAEGRAQAGGPPWRLETIKASMPGEAAFARVKPPEEEAADRLFAVSLHRPYDLEGVLDLPPAGGVPVRETCTASDTGQAVSWTTTRRQGEHAVDATLYRPASALAEGLRWTCSVDVHGVDSVTGVVEVPALAPAVVAAETPQVGDAGPLAEQLAAAVARRDEALAAAGTVASACTTAEEQVRIASDDVLGLKGRIQGARDALAHATTAAEAVAGSDEESAAALEAAKSAHTEALAAKRRLDTAVRGGCTKGMPATVAAERAAVEEQSARVAELTASIRARRDAMAAVEREGRRLQDAVWALDPALSFLETSAGTARSTLKKRGDEGTRVATLAEEAEAGLAEADAAWKAAGKSRKNKPALDAIAVLATEIQTAALHATCIEQQTAALAAIGEEVSTMIGEAGEVATERALLDKSLPTATLSHDVTARYVQARALQAELDALHGDLVMASDHAATCPGKR